jgi:hypothetical protein
VIGRLYNLFEKRLKNLYKTYEDKSLRSCCTEIKISEGYLGRAKTLSEDGNVAESQRFLKTCYENFRDRSVVYKELSAIFEHLHGRIEGER